MGTKSNPGQFDCYAKAALDEPIFTLRAKDPSAPYFVMAWTAMRNGDLKGVMDCMVAMQCNNNVIGLISKDGYAKLEEARRCAMNMREWREAHEVQADAVSGDG